MLTKLKKREVKYKVSLNAFRPITKKIEATITEWYGANGKAGGNWIALPITLVPK